MRSFSGFIQKWAGLIVLVGTLLAVVGAFYSVLLYKNLRTNIEELLPATARSVIDMDEVTHRLESIDNLAILVFCSDTKASKRFVDDLAAVLEKAPPNIITSVEYRIDKELKFFKDRQVLYMEVDDLIKVKNYIQQRLVYEKKIRNPLNIFSQETIPEPYLNFAALKKKYEGKVSAYSRFTDGYYATQDGKKRVVLAYMPGKSSGIDQIHRIKNYVVQAIAKLNPTSYAPDLEIHYTGGVENMLEEQGALVADLELSTVIVVVLVTLAMFIFFRAFRATVALIFSLFSGTLWTFGVAYFAVGYLNANSAFLGSIVIGNGINFGIIFLARYLEERRNHLDHESSLNTTMSHTSIATWTAALAAGLSYGSLILTSFRGFKQFGIIGLIGMILCWVSTYTMLPALLTVLDRMKALVPANQPTRKSIFAEGLANFVSKNPRAIWSVSMGLTLVALAMFSRFTPRIIETNLANMRSKSGSTGGSTYMSKYMDEIFQRYLSPMALLPRSLKDTEIIGERLKELKAKQGEKGLIAAVQTIGDFLPKNQEKKIEVLREIDKLLPPHVLARASVEDQKLVREFLNPTTLRPIQMSELPKLVLDRFTEKDGSIGKLVLVEPPLDDSTWEGNRLTGIVADLRNTADSVAPGTPVAGHLPIASDMVEAVTRDGPRATVFAFLAVFILVVFLFRSGKTIGLILFSLMLGIVWMAGVVLGFGFKINFLNFIALPITFGIGVDYGVNIFQRYREEGGNSILKVIRDTGGAVALCSFSTIVGYSSLLIADNRGFVSFGVLAVLGEVTCALAAIVVLPAYLLLRDRRKTII